MNNFTDPFVRSIVVAAVSVALTFVPAVGLGYLFARRRVKGQAIWETLAMLPLILPPVVSGFVLLYLLAPAGPVGGILFHVLGVRIPFTLTAAILAASLVSFPLFLRGARNGFANVPHDLEEAAASLGHTPRSVFRTVSLPLARPGVINGAVLAYARALGEFGATMVVAGNIPGRTQTLPTAIYQAAQLGDIRTGWQLVALAASLAFILMLVSYRLERA